MQPLDQFQFAYYTDGNPVIDEYDINPGVCILPIAEDSPTSTDPAVLAAFSPVVKLKLHAPYRIRRSSTRTNKTSAPPVIPAPEDTGKFVFMGGSVHFEKALNTSLNTYDWFVGTDYMFVENCVSRNQDGYVLGVVPWTWISSVANVQTYGAPNPQVGAISQAGYDSKIGYAQGLAALDGTGNLRPGWVYNTTSFFPGCLANNQLINGGPQNVIDTGLGALFVPPAP